MPMLERGAFGWGLYAKPMGAWSYVCRGKGETFPGRGSVWRVVAWETYGCVDVGDHSLTGQRMAPHTPQESPQVKTKCIGVGLTRLYAPMVPLAPHPCVRWWNTKEITLKLPRLDLTQLEEWFHPPETIPSP
jgi:hypothetical protein